MSLHSMIEPAGTLLTGWKLVTEPTKAAADVRNEDDPPPGNVDEGDRTPPPAPPGPAERSRREVGKAG